MKLPELPPPIGVIPPHALIPPLTDLQPLPRLTAIPGRVATPALEFHADSESNYRSAIDAFLDKVRAEDARMRRLLPPAPRGMQWQVELQTREPDYNLPMNRADMLVRLVYKLKEI